MPDADDNTVLTFDTTDDDCGEIDFAEMATTVRTPEESARVRDLKRRRDIAGGIAYDGALASGQTPAQARRAAKFAREAVVS